MKVYKVAALAAGSLAAASLALLSQYKKQTRKALHISGQGGIDQGEYVYIGGIEQYLYHRGRDTSHPVLLMLHGGPGAPELPFLHKFQLTWEARVTVVHWDQRNAGKTFFRNKSGEITPTTTMEQLIEDTDEVVSYLKRKYSVDKIIIMGHSWGSVLGSAYIKRYPEAVRAYIGVGQVVNMAENERIGFEKALEAAKAAGCRADVAKLEALEPYPGKFDSVRKNMLKLRSIQCKYKLASAYTWKNVKMVLGSPFYSLWEGLFFLRADAQRGQCHLYEDLFLFDLPTLGTQYKVPYFIIQGEQDWQTPYPLAEAYQATVQAPMSGFYGIPGAGHFTMIDQEQLFVLALFEILDRLEA